MINTQYFTGVPRLGGRTVIATCPSPKKVIGGGASSNNPNLLITANEIYDPDATSWVVNVQNTTNIGQNGYVRATAICGIVQ